MGAFSEIFFLPVTFVSCNTLLIHYYKKILQTGHFVSQTSPQDKHLQKKGVYHNVANENCDKMETKTIFGDTSYGV